MKIRNGFVSNSSSSSFICDVCGHDESGYDMTINEAGMVECEHGHIFCECHLIGGEKSYEKIREEFFKRDDINEVISDFVDSEEEVEDFINELKEDIDNFTEFYDDRIVGDYDEYVPIEKCPLCSFKSISDEDFISFLKKDKEITKESIVKEISLKFKDYQEFKDWKKS